MNLSNHPIASPDRPLVAPGAALDPPEVSVVSPQVSTAPSRPRVVTTLGADMIGSLQSLLGTVIIAIFVITFVVQAFQIPSESMENTLLVGDYLLVNKLCYGGHGLGDHLMPYQKIVARGHHRISLSRRSDATLREASDWRAGRPPANDQQEGFY